MASLECAHEYQNALEEGPVCPGDLLNVPAGFLKEACTYPASSSSLPSSPPRVCEDVPLHLDTELLVGQFVDHEGDVLEVTNEPSWG